MIRDFAFGIWCCAVAAVFCQAPEFLQQYLQRLGGHLDEVRRLDRQLPQVAERVSVLRAAHDTLATADALTRPFIFVRHVQTEIAWNTLTHYRPAIPLTSEAAVYALVGVGFAALTAYPLRRRSSLARA
jgi:hypothetical protein